MSLYLIAFKDEWAPDLTLEQRLARLHRRAVRRDQGGRIAVAVGWPQEVHRLPHRIGVTTDSQSEALS